MDEVTQQNSALVEQNAAAAKSLEQQSQAMDQRVSTFRLDEAPAAAARRPPWHASDPTPTAAGDPLRPPRSSAAWSAACRLRS